MMKTCLVSRVRVCESDNVGVLTSAERSSNIKHSLVSFFSATRDQTTTAEKTMFNGYLICCG
jgi:hypothetical protein